MFFFRLLRPTKRRRWVRIILWCLSFLALSLGILGWYYRDLVSYAVMQFKGQWTLIQGAIPLNEAMQTAPYADQWSDQLQFVIKVKTYAADSLGLDTANTYASVYFPDSSSSASKMWVVTACAPYAFKPYQWHFPLIGSYPYKGFFDSTAASMEQKRLDALGYDTNCLPAEAWSTLGWIENPLRESMLKLSKERLADLLIHELVHNTLYVKDSATFNENLATFIAYEGTRAFLSFHYGELDELYINHTRRKVDRARYTAQWLRVTLKLDSLYTRWQLTLPPIAYRKARKEEVIAQFVAAVDTVQFENPKWNSYLKKVAKKANNAMFMGYLRYYGKIDEIEKDFRQHRMTLATYIDSLKIHYAKRAL